MDAAETAQRLAFGAWPTATRRLAVAGPGSTTPRAAAPTPRACARSPARIAPGLAADYLLVDLDVPELAPSWDLSWELVRLTGRDQIVAVVVAGRPRLWRGWPVDWDARQLIDDVRRRARKVVADAPVQIVHPTSTEHRTASRTRDSAG